MTHPLIQVQNLTKTYRVPGRPEGLSASLKILLNPRYSEVTAVQDPPVSG